MHKETEQFKLEAKGNGISFLIKTTKPYKQFNLSFWECSQLLEVLADLTTELESASVSPQNQSQKNVG